MPALATSKPDPFVGREVELDELADQLTRMLSGRPAVTLLTGEAGVGKSRLLRELAVQGRHLGAQVAYGRAIEGASTPYLPFLSLFDLRARELMHELALREPGVRGAELAPERLHFFAAFIRHIVVAAQNQPLLVLLDDLHWADPASLDLLGQLMFALLDPVHGQRLSLMIVCAHRPVPHDHALSALSLQLQREGIAFPLELSGLTLTEIQSLLVGLGLHAVDQPLLQAVQDATHGNPLFVREIPTQLSRGASAHFALPRGLTNVLGQRLKNLSREDIELLELAALLSDQLSLQRIARVAELDSEQALQLLQRAVDAELMVADGAAFRFRHPLIRELLASRAHATERSAMHARIASALEAEGTSGELSLEIAGHLLATTEPDQSRLLSHAWRGADHAFAVFAWAKAAQLYAVAADAARACGVPAAELALLEYQCALAHQHQFDFGPSFTHYSAALRAYTEAADSMGQARTLRNLTRLRYSSNETRYGQLMDLSTHERMLQQLDRREPAVRGVLLEAMALAYWTARQTARAEALARQALALGERTGDTGLCADARFTLGLVLWQAGQLADAHACMSDCKERWIRDDPWARLLPLQRMCSLDIGMGQLAQAERACDDADLQTGRICNIAEESFVAANRAIIAPARGQLRAVRQSPLDATQLARRSRWGFGALHSLMALSLARSFAGQHEDALYAIDTLAKPGEFYASMGSGVRFVIAVWRDYLLLRVHPESATRELRQRFARASRAIDAVPIDANAASLYCVLIESARLLNDPSLVGTSGARLEQLYRDGMLLTDAALLLPRVLAESAFVRGELESAEQYFVKAELAAESCGAALELGRSLLGHADLLAHGLSPLRAAELVQRANSVLARLGLCAAHVSATRTVAEAGSAASLSDAAPAQTSLTARDHALLRRISQGRGHAQIARDLLLDPARVAVLADALYAKLDVDGPSLASAYALVHGISAPLAAAKYDSTVVMVTDMVDFTGLVQRLGDLAARRVMHVHNRVIRRQLSRHGGEEVTHTGDGLIAAFAAADQAIACARAIQHELTAQRATDQPVVVRIGLNLGRVLPEEDRLFGAALIQAVRICARAQGGQILLSESVSRALTDRAHVQLTALGKVPLKGFDAPAELFSLANESQLS